MRKLLIFTVTLCFACSAFAQEAMTTTENYQRSSLYMTLIKGTKQFSHEIRNAFVELPVPDKFNDHNVGPKIFPLYAVPQDTPNKSGAITAFMEDNDVARRIVARWFDRNRETGIFNIDLITERGLYNASALDKQYSSLTKRGEALIMESGEELIGSTFVIVNDIKYIDKERNAKVASKTLKFLGAIGAAATGSNSVGDLFDTGAAISDMISGFTVNVTSYLYQMVWNDEMSGALYGYYWCDHTMDPAVISAKKELFDNCHGQFKLKYVGSYSAKSMKTVLRGKYSNESVVKLVCARALDKNIVELQRTFDQFKVRVPISRIEKDNRGKDVVMAYIGIKEGVQEDIKYEVLEKSRDEEGKVQYRRVGVVQPVKGMIWDNRFMAAEEQEVGSDLNATTFRIISGKNFYPGLLLREIK